MNKLLALAAQPKPVTEHARTCHQRDLLALLQGFGCTQSAEVVMFTVTYLSYVFCSSLSKYTATAHCVACATRGKRTTPDTSACTSKPMLRWQRR